MSNFKNFFNSIKNENSAVQSKSNSEITVTFQINSILTANSTLGLLSKSGKKEIAAKEFSKNVSQLVHSNEFLDEFSENIGLPKENESEDQFVDRAKKTMKTLLLRKLSK